MIAQLFTFFFQIISYIQERINLTHFPFLFFILVNKNIFFKLESEKIK